MTQITSSNITESPRSRARSAIRQLIEGSALQIGERLPAEESLSKQLAVSRTTIRKALDELEGNGLVRREPNRGCVVASQLTPASRLVGQSVVVVTDKAHVKVDQHVAGTFAEVRVGLFDTIVQQGRSMVMVPVDTLNDRLMQQLIAERPVGVLLLAWEHMTENMSSFGKACRDAGIPVVAYNSDDDDPEVSPFDRVQLDHESGTHQLMNWLHARNRSRVLRLWTCPADEPFIVQRNAGYKRACQSLGMPELPLVYVNDLPDRQANSRQLFERRTRCMAGYLAEYLREPGIVDAIMVVTDCEVFNVAAACRLLGREPNRDVMIVGYDNAWSHADERQYESTLPAATVEKSNRRIGAALADLLEQRIDGTLAQNQAAIQKISHALVEVANV